MKFSAIAVAALFLNSSVESFGSMRSRLVGNFGRRLTSTTTTRRAVLSTAALSFNSLFAATAAPLHQTSTCPSMTASRTLATRGGTALNSAVAEDTEKVAPTEVFRNDYRPLPHFVTKINMDFKIEDGKTTVVSELFVESNPDVKDSASQDMVLDGDETCVKLIKLQVDGRDLVEGEVRYVRHVVMFLLTTLSFTSFLTSHPLHSLPRITRLFLES
jgi:hypothetical protein